MTDESLVGAARADLVRRRDEAKARLDELQPQVEAASSELDRLGRLAADARSVVEAADEALKVLDGGLSHAVVSLVGRRRAGAEDLDAVREIMGGDQFTVQDVIGQTGMNYSAVRRLMELGEGAGAVRVVSRGGGQRPRVYQFAGEREGDAA